MDVTPRAFDTGLKDKGQSRMKSADNPTASLDFFTICGPDRI
jgi:hypothetical protein